VSSALDGRDGAVVQADLREVIERAKDARAMLGLRPTDGAVEARAAFHALCKKYHPARFARSSAETVRLANEAFLAIKHAYDELVEAEGAKPEAPRAGGTRGSNPPPAKPGPGAVIPRPQVPSPAIARTTTPVGPAVARTTTPVGPAVARTTTPVGPAVARTTTPTAATPSSVKATVSMRAMPADRDRTDKPDKLERADRTDKVPRVGEQTDKVPVADKPADRDKATVRLPAQERPVSPVGKPTERMTPVPRPALDRGKSGPIADKDKASPAAPDPSEEQRYAAALDLLRRRLWKDGEKALHELAVSHPTERRYRAYRDYARGRLAQDAGRLDEARVEWERALRLDPDLAAAKAALDQLPEQPRPPSGGLLSKLFKRS